MHPTPCFWYTLATVPPLNSSSYLPSPLAPPLATAIRPPLPLIPPLSFITDQISLLRNPNSLHWTPRPPLTRRHFSLLRVSSPLPTLVYTTSNFPPAAPPAPSAPLRIT
ncbi:unnamed protein product [Dicrocoelium dendriticum]|nr:unnamed protein product [Dicrocoelium dendriticum]